MEKEMFKIYVKNIITGKLQLHQNTSTLFEARNIAWELHRIGLDGNIKKYFPLGWEIIKEFHGNENWE